MKWYPTAEKVKEERIYLNEAGENSVNGGIKQAMEFDGGFNQ